MRLNEQQQHQNFFSIAATTKQKANDYAANKKNQLKYKYRHTKKTEKMKMKKVNK